jgi:hypothetical protein
MIDLQRIQNLEFRSQKPEERLPSLYLYTSVALLATFTTFHVVSRVAKVRIHSRNSHKSPKPILTDYNLFKPIIDPPPPEI